MFCLKHRLANYLKKTIFRRDTLFVQAVTALNIVKGPILILLVTIYLTPVEIGVWYTFVSMSALISLADLGVSNNLMHFISRELRGGDSFDKKVIFGEIAGNAAALALVRKFLIVFLLLLFFVAFSIVIAGFFFLGLNSEYIKEWVLFSVGGAGLVFCATLQAVVVGLGRLTSVYFDKFLGVVLNIVFVAFSLWMGAGLWSLPIGLWVMVAVSTGLLWSKNAKFFLQLFATDVIPDQKRFHSMIKLNLKSSIYWAFYILGFQIIVPLTFKIMGAATAGKVGIWLSALHSLGNFANSSIVSRLPTYSQMIGAGRSSDAISLMKRDVTQKLYLHVFLLFLFFMICSVVPPLTDLLRMYELQAPLLLAMHTLALGYAFSWASCIRAFQIEAFLWHSAAIFMSISIIYILGGFLHWSIAEVLFGTVLVQCVALVPAARLIVRKNLDGI